MPIPLPVLQLHLPNMPAPPNDPPDNHDILGALDVVRQINNHHEGVPLQGQVVVPPKEDKAVAELYLHQILTAASPVTVHPATRAMIHDEVVAENTPLRDLVGNFREEMRRTMADMQGTMANMQGTMATMQVAIAGLQDNVGGLRGDVNTLLQLSTMAQNRSRGDGSINPYYPVPSLNGQAPQLHGLPPLPTRQAIDGLSDGELVGYLNLYQLQVHGDRATRLAVLRTFIGSTPAT